MKWFKLALIVGVATLAVSASTAQAGRLYLSLSSTAPTEYTGDGTNPTLNITQGGTGSLYMWWLPGTDSTGSGREELTNFSHDIVSSNPILTRSGGSYLIDNPGSRWTSTNNLGATATAATYIWDNVTAPNLSGWATSTSDALYNAASGSWRVAQMTFNNDSLGLGTTSIRIGVGSGKINFNTTPTSGRQIFFGWGDASIAGNSNINGSNTTTVADATVNVVAAPEPATLALLGMGMIGLVAVARRRRRT